MAATPSRLVLRLGLLGAVLVATLLALELGLRLFAPVAYLAPVDRLKPASQDWSELVHRPSAVEGLNYELNPEFAGEARGMDVRVNSRGMRDDEPLPDETPGLVRVAVIGDSVTFGYRVASDETYANVLERELNAARAGGEQVFEVLNLGVSGYSTADEVNALRGHWLELEPDAVVLGYFLNDPDHRPTQPLQSLFREVEWWHRSHLLRWIAQRRYWREQQRLGGGNYYRWLHHPEGRPWRSVERALDDLAAAASEDGLPMMLPVVVAIFPATPRGSWDDYAYEDLHEQVANAALGRGFEVVDLLPAFREHEPDSLCVAPEDNHPNALGHLIAAEAIQPTLESSLRGVVLTH